MWSDRVGKLIFPRSSWQGSNRVAFTETSSFILIAFILTARWHLPEYRTQQTTKWETAHFIPFSISCPNNDESGQIESSKSLIFPVLTRVTHNWQTTALPASLKSTLCGYDVGKTGCPARIPWTCSAKQAKWYDNVPMRDPVDGDWSFFWPMWGATKRPL